MKQIEFFFWGTLAALGALIAEIVLLYVLPSLFPTLAILQDSNIYYFLIVAALSEEVFKYSVLIYKRKKVVDWNSWILKIILVGLGFSLFEVFSNYYSNPAIFPVFSAIEIILIHLLTVGTAGLLMVVLRNKYKFIPIILVMSLLHFVSNAMIFFDFSDSIILTFLIVALIIIFFLFYGQRRKNLPIIIS